MKSVVGGIVFTKYFAKLLVEINGQVSPTPRRKQKYIGRNATARKRALDCYLNCISEVVIRVQREVFLVRIKRNQSPD